MVRFHNYDIVFAEIPDEVSLAVNLTGCPNRCPGCHSAHLQADSGYVLDEEAIEVMLGIYGTSITCFCFMGGDSAPAEVNALARYLRLNHGGLKVAWYSGCTDIADQIELKNFDYIKVGPWIEERGPLSSPTTNQRIFRILEDGTKMDITSKMRKKSLLAE